MKYKVYYDSKSHGEKVGKKSKRRWFVNDPASNPEQDGRPVWSYKKSEAIELTDDQAGVVIGMATIMSGYSGLQKVAV